MVLEWFCGFQQSIFVWNLEERFIHRCTIADKERAELPAKYQKLHWKQTKRVLLRTEEAEPPHDWYRHWRNRALWKKRLVWLWIRVTRPFGSNRKWHTFLCPSNKINPNPSSSAISILIIPSEMTWTWFVPVSLHVGTQKKVYPASSSVYLYN